MKKLYSIVLMAAALLIGTNMWATTLSEIQTAIDEAPAGGTVTITLNSDVEIDATPIQIYAKKAEAGKTVNIDLAGFSIFSKVGSAPVALIELYKGTLNLKGTGTLTTEGENGIKVFGCEDPAQANWSVLNVGKNVQVLCNGGNITSTWKATGIGVFGFWGKDVYTYLDYAQKGNLFDGNASINYYDDNATYQTYMVDASKVKSAYQATYVTAVKREAIQLAKDGKIDYSTSFPTYNKEATIKKAYTTGKVAFAVAQYSAEMSKAFGVNVNVEGTVYGKYYGVKLNGTVQYLPTSDDDHIPYFHIAEGANVTCSDNLEGAVAAYVSGYGKWEIEGAIAGNIGVYVKSGEVDITGNATVTSTNSTNHDPLQATTSGVQGGGGSAVVIESNSSYCGGQDVTISGDAVVTGAAGYGIEEVVTSAATSTVEAISIEGGEINNGAAGTIKVTDASKNEVEITGGTIVGGTNATDIGGQTLTEFLDTQSGSTHATVVETDAQGNQTIVISEGPAPATGNSVIAAAEGSSVNWIVTENKAETLTADKTLTELQISSADYTQTLTIADGVTLSVGRVVLGAKAQIIVKAGAKLIVTGTEGLAAFQESNLVLENENGKRSIFLFNPAVESNTHPMATVELITNSWRNSATDLQWEILGLPTYEAVTSINKEGTAPVAISVWENGAWTSVGVVGSTAIDLSKLNKTFAPYDMLANRAYGADAPKLIIGGKLVGKTNGSLYANYRWTPYANSYTGEMDLKAFVTALGGAQSIAQGIWVAEQQGNGHLAWNPIDVQSILDGDAEILKLAPMQAFMLNNPGNINEYAALDYASMVWAPATTPAAPAPARVAASETTAKVRVLVTDEQGIVDKVMVRENANNVYALEKYLNEDMNIYVLDGEKNAIVNAETLENKYIGFSTVKGGKFTMSFANVAGRELALIDHETGAQVAMVEGATYEFTANGTNDYRFEIVGAAKMPTAIENAEAVKSAKGIYTITGQYVGEMNVWNSLPAGIYVVNGEKCVK